MLGSLLLAGCTQSAGPRPENVSVDPAMVRTFATDSSLPFQFPLEDYDPRTAAGSASFCMSGIYPPEYIEEYHAAEDCYRPAGTAVYAMADGRVSFSGPVNGYGWLIVIDHPEANLYSSYGHVSPNRWRIESGTVMKGELIGYLGDSSENTGIPAGSLSPHLHFGVRAGQRVDYPSRGDSRWQAGWVSAWPQDIGWLQPSAIVASQHVPAGGYPGPRKVLPNFSKSELLATAICMLGSAGMLFTALKRNRLFFLVFLGIVLVIVEVVLRCNAMLGFYVLSPIVVMLPALGLVVLKRRHRQRRSCEGKE
jgi:hypothetical protein